MNDTRISNSLDALDANRDRFELFEIDLSWTSDGQLVSLHDWDASFAVRFSYRPDGPLTLPDFETPLGDGKLENFTLPTLSEWMRRNPEKRVVTDLKDRKFDGLQMINSVYPTCADSSNRRLICPTKSRPSRHWALPTRSVLCNGKAATPTRCWRRQG